MTELVKDAEYKAGRRIFFYCGPNSPDEQPNGAFERLFNRGGSVASFSITLSVSFRIGARRNRSADRSGARRSERRPTGPILLAALDYRPRSVPTVGGPVGSYRARVRARPN